MVLRPAQRLHAFAALGRFGIDVLGNRRRPHKTQGFDFRRFNQRIHSALVPVHHAQHAFGQTGFLQQLRDQQRGTWITLRWFQDETVTAHDRQRVHPQRHHRREVERSNTRHHTQRLEIRPRINVRPHVTAVLALENLRRRACVFDVLDAALQFTRGVLQGLAVLLADQLRDTRFVLLQQLLETKHHLGTLGWRRIAPGRERRLGRVDRLLNGFTAGQWHLVNHLAGGRVVHVGTTAAVIDQLTVDQMLDKAHAGLLKSCSI
ncbi:hypothetical protein ALP97_200313 [Pseudomonas salomonii]|uniref:Uncharacterized protein n=1 Tax=Pseudomonas salomonii TaxID=191391 RepID=A0A3M4Q9L0_9PSED|nr:hypothetical protein ALP97_200313 [Pseudomonas salomonii]